MGLKIKKLFAALKNKTNLIIFAITFIVLFSPTWLCALLGFIFNNGWLLGVAATYWAFWLAPFTPFFPIVIAVTFAVRKFYDKLKKNKESKLWALNDSKTSPQKKKKILSLRILPFRK